MYYIGQRVTYKQLEWTIISVAAECDTAVATKQEDRGVGYNLYRLKRSTDGREQHELAWQYDLEVENTSLYLPEPHEWIYASWHRPLSALWAHIEHAHYLPCDETVGGYYTLVVVPASLDTTIREDYELTLLHVPEEVSLYQLVQCYHVRSLDATVHIAGGPRGIFLTRMADIRDVLREPPDGETLQRKYRVATLITVCVQSHRVQEEIEEALFGLSFRELCQLIEEATGKVQGAGEVVSYLTTYVSESKETQEERTLKRQ